MLGVWILGMYWVGPGVLGQMWGTRKDIEDAVLLGASRTGGHAEAIYRQYPSQGQTEASEGVRSSDMGEVVEEKGRKQWRGMEAGGGRGYSRTLHHHLTFIL